MLGNTNVKLLMSWDIKPGRDQDYFEFIVREWTPGINKLGIEQSGAWYTLYSRDDTPQMMAEAIAEDLKTMRSVLASDEWTELHDQLLKFVENYTQKVVYVSGGFQI